MNKIARYLNEHTYGSVFSADRILEDYSTDCSVLKIKPDVVALPSSAEDIRKILRFADQLTYRNVPTSVTIRGSGRDKTGACLGSGIILSMQNMNKISEIDVRQRLVRCQAGVTLGQLNSALALHGLTLNISGDPDETIGGLIANAGRDDSDQKLKSIHHCLEKAELVLPTGDILQTETYKAKVLKLIKTQSNAEGRLYRNLANLISDHSDDIEDLLSPTVVTPVGYSSVARLMRENGTFNFAPLLFSSQGTIAVIAEVILRCEFLAAPPSYFFAKFTDIDDALEFADSATDLDPATLDIYDLSILRKVKNAGKTLRPLDVDAERPGFLLAVSFSDIKPSKRRKKLRSLSNFVESAKQTAVSSDDNYEGFTELHAILLTYLNDTVKTTRVSLADGAFVPTSRFSTYLKGLKAIEESYECELHIFGSYLTSTYSVRPDVNLGSITGRRFILGFLRDYHKLLDGIGGSIVGDAPEGRVKGLITTPILDEKLVQIYTEVKKIFDPRGILNPGVKLDVNLRSTIRALRTEIDSGIIT